MTAVSSVPAPMLAMLLRMDRVTALLTWLLWLMEGLAVAAVLAMVVRYASSLWYPEVVRRRAVLLAVGTGSAAAMGAAILACGGPFLLPGTAGMVEAAEYVLAAAAAGGAGSAACWLALEERPKLRPLPVLAMVLAGWLLLPCLVMLARGHSPYALAAALVLTVFVVIGVRRMAPLAVAEEEEGTEPKLVLPSLYGMKLDHWAWKSAAVVALCLTLAVALAVAEWTLAACIALMLGVTIVVWRWSAVLRRRRAPRERWLWLRAGSAAAVSFAAMLLMQQLAPRLGMVAGAPAIPVVKAPDRHSYFSVVLLPPLQKKKVLPPMPKERRPSARSGKAEPVEIPFTGPYWYFQPPLLRPDDAAHLAHGRATEVDVRSVDDDLLLMEAHQPLLKPVALSCCREIDVAMTNADTGLGLIAVELVLRDSSQPRTAPLLLPAQTLASSENGAVELHKGSVDEVLHFPVDTRHAGRMKRFDEIDVLFLPTPMRRRKGTKVEIRSFTLQP